MIAAPGIRQLTLFCLGLLLAGSLVSTAAAQSSEAEQRRREAVRDSLRTEIARYAELIESLKASVAEIDTAEKSEDQYVEFEESAEAIGEAISLVTEQLSELELEVSDGSISLTDGQGGRVTLEIPEDLGEHLGEGIESITRLIMEEMPDTVRAEQWSAGLPFGRPRVLEPETCRVIDGDMVKLKDDLEIAADEVVTGNVVAIMGDAVVEGRVEGNVVVVLGDLTLGEDADIDGEVVTVLGRLDRADGAVVGALTVVNPGGVYLPALFSDDVSSWVEFWGGQAFFLLLLLLVLLIIALTPRQRVETMRHTLTTRAFESFGVGLLMAIVGHLVMLVLAVILFFTVIGAPVAVLVAVAMVLVDLAAVGLASMAVGRRLCDRAESGRCQPGREVLLGMLVLHVPAFLAALIGALGLPGFLVILLLWLGRIVKFGAFCFGLGALVLSRFGGTSPREPMAAPLDSVAENPGT